MSTTDTLKKQFHKLGPHENCRNSKNQWNYNPKNWCMGSHNLAPHGADKQTELGKKTTVQNLTRFAMPVEQVLATPVSTPVKRKMRRLHSGCDRFGTRWNPYNWSRYHRTNRNPELIYHPPSSERTPTITVTIKFSKSFLQPGVP